MTMYSESLRAFLKPVLPYLDDDTVSEVMINAPDDVWIERNGRLEHTDARFTEEGLLGAARNMAQYVGRPLTDERPRLDARLPDGSRIHVVLPPIARKGATICIRKFFREKLGMDSLLSRHSLTKPMARLIEAAIGTRLNMMVSGGTGSGKTTLLNIVSSLIPDDERILTIEDSAELQLQQRHLLSFESRPPDKYGKGGVDMGDLLHSALRLRPDRIIVGEVRGGECFHLLQAMNTGHAGSLSTCHANSPTDALRRLESLCLMGSQEMPLVAVRAQVASAIHLIVMCERLPDGTRRVTHLSEVLPLSDRGEYRTQDLFVFTPVSRDADGRVLGYHAPTGIVPTFARRARSYGFTDLDDAFFDPATYGLPVPTAGQVGVEHATRWAPSLKHREQGRPDPSSLESEREAYARTLISQAADAPPSSRTGHAPPPSAGPSLTVPGRPPAQRAGPAAPSVNRPRPSGAVGPAAPKDNRSRTLDEEVTPPPRRNPLLAKQGPHEAERTGEDAVDPALDAALSEAMRAPPPPLPDEPSVQISASLMEDALPQRPAGRPGASPPPSHFRPGAPQRRPADSEGEETVAPRSPSSRTEEKTHIKPIPDRLRRG